MSEIDLHTLELIHGDIDGTNSPAQADELQALLQQNAVARSRYQELTRLAEGLAGLPEVESPENLCHNVMALLARQGEPVSPRRTEQSAGHWPRLLTALSPQSIARSMTMSTEKKNTFNNNRVWTAVGVLAVAVATIGYLDLAQSPDEAQLTGSIAPAARYRAEQISADDVVLGDQAIVELMQTDAFTSVINDESTAKLLQDLKFRNLMQDLRFRNLMQDLKFRNLMQDLRFRNLMQDARFQELLRRAQAEQLMQNVQMQALMQDARFAELMQNGQMQELLRNAKFSELMQNAQMQALMQDSRFVELLSRAKFSELMQNGRFQFLMQDARHVQALQDAMAAQGRILAR